ncbi:MAG TPA: hypothetical protein VG125_01075 [Pirellulales bacterium]|nr:hypothetical protein [Pirellulales bacterium]
MRYLLILLAACLPLAVLTVGSLWQAAAARPSSAADAGQPDVAAIAKRADGVVEREKQTGDLCKSLPQIDLLETGGPDLPEAADDEFKAAWNRSQEARRLVSQYAKADVVNVPADASPRVRRRQAETSLARLKAFVMDHRQKYVGQVQGADEFFALLDRRARQLEDEIGVYHRQDRMADAEAAAKSDLDQGRYEACLKRLDTDPLAQATDADQLDRLQLLRKRAEYRLAWEALDQTGATAGSDLFNEIQAFLRKYPDPPSSAEHDLQAQLERRRDRLKSEISVHVLDEASDLDTLLVEALQIVSNKQIEEPIKQKARHQVAEWLAHRLPKIGAPSSLLGKQEAVTKSGQRKIGIFLLPAGAEQFRFWTDRRNRGERPRGDEQIPRGALEQPPGKPQYVVWAEQYSDRVAVLVHQPAGRTDWQQFANDCETWQQQIAAYREEWGVDDEPDRSCREWSFREAAALARNLLQRWPQYEQVMRPSP